MLELESVLPVVVREESPKYRTQVCISTKKTCECTGKKMNCLTAKEWIKSQIGVWQFNYEKRDVRDKTVHPATFPPTIA